MLEILLIVLQIAVVIAIPFGVSYSGEVLIHQIAHHEFSELPVLTTLARLQGLVAGGLLLHVDLNDRHYDLQFLFVEDSP